MAAKPMAMAPAAAANDPIDANDRAEWEDLGTNFKSSNNATAAGLALLGESRA
jgi:hypothetical protein